MNTLRSVSLFAVAQPCCRRLREQRRRNHGSSARRGRHREHEPRRRLSAARQHHAGHRATAACVGAGSAARRGAFDDRARLRSDRQPRGSRDPLPAARRSSTRTTAAPRTPMPCSSAAGRTAGPMPSRISAARPTMPNYATPEVALTNAGVCARERGRRRGRRGELPRGARAQSDLPRRAAEHDRALVPGRELPPGARVRAALSRQSARRLRPCSGCASTSSASSTTAAAAERCATQLRNGFRGSAELAQLEEQQRRDGR